MAGGQEVRIISVIVVVSATLGCLRIGSRQTGWPQLMIPGPLWTYHLDEHDGQRPQESTMIQGYRLNLTATTYRFKPCSYSISRDGCVSALSVLVWILFRMRP